MSSICFHRSIGVLLPACVLLFAGCKEQSRLAEAERRETLAAYGMVEGKDASKVEAVEVVEPVEVVETPVAERDLVGSEWKELLDPELAQWSTYLTAKRDKSITASDVFSVERQEGELVLEISGECPGSLMSVEEFGDYHLALEYKWGENASDKPKESGLVYHSFGKKGNVVGTWMQGVEFDISESSTGGLYAIAGITTNVASEPIDKKSSRYVPGAAMHKIAQSFEPGVRFRSIEQTDPFKCLPLEAQRGDDGGWVRLDLYVVGDSAQHYVDGKLVLELQDAGLQYVGKDRRDLVEGKLQIQAESAPISFRKIRIAEIDALPEI